MTKNPANNTHRRGIAPTQTVAVAMAAMEQIQSRAHGMPGLGVLSGRPGLGKTSALTRLAHPADINAVYIACRSFETTKSLAQLVLKELGETVKDRWSVPTMFDVACERFAEQGRPLVVDEADRIAEKTAIEFLRDIHDIGQVPILLVGEENLQRKLANKHERFHDRVLVWAHAMPVDNGDLAKLMGHYTPGLHITDDARKALVMKTGGVARRVVTMLHGLQELSKTRGLGSITIDEISEVQ
jgi:DNA transposition AAA+ family ATPase